MCRYVSGVRSHCVHSSLQLKQPLIDAERNRIQLIGSRRCESIPRRIVWNPTHSMAINAYNIIIWVGTDSMASKTAAGNVEITVHVRFA